MNQAQSQREFRQNIQQQIREKNRDIRNDIKMQSMQNEKMIRDEKMKDHIYKQERRKVIQSNLLQSQETIDQYWHDRMNKHHTMKTQIYNQDSSEINRNQMILEQLENEEMKMIQELEKKHADYAK